MPVKFITPEGGGECGGYLAYISCPVCGLPIVEGRCKAGHPWEVRILNLSELPDFFDSIDPTLTHLELIDGSDAYEDKEKKWVRFLVSNIFEAERIKKDKETVISVYIDTQYTNVQMIRSAIEDILVEYLYRKECKNPIKIYEQWFPKEHRLRRNFSVRVSQTIAKYLREASEYYQLPPGKLIESYARKWWADEVEGESENSD